MAVNYEQARRGYQNLWESSKIVRAGDVNAVATKLIPDKMWYVDVQTETGVPWFWTACVHHREGGFNDKWLRVLHNGEKIVGTGAKTRLVPKGRGPFSNWRESAYDALKWKGLDKIELWPISRCLYEMEKWNGWGYWGRIRSPYVWASTNHQQRGKYVADSVWDANHWDTQLGTAALLRGLMNLDETIQDYLESQEQGGDPVDPPPPPDDPDEVIQQHIDEIKKLDARIKGVGIVY